MTVTSALLRPSILVLAVLALVVGLAVGCGPAGTPKQEVRTTSDGATVVTVWQGFNAEETAVFHEIMRDFEADYAQRTGKKIKVDVQYVSFNDMFTKLKTAALARKTPDVAMMDAIKVTDLAFGRALVPLDDLAPFKERYGTREAARDQFVGASFDSGVVNRQGEIKLYGLPVQTTTVALFWNREMFRNKAADLRAAGLDPNRTPVDWDEFLAYAKVLTDKERGIYGTGLSSSLWFQFPFFNMYGADFIAYDDKGRASSVLDSPNMKMALERLRILITSDIEAGAWKRGALGPEQGFINRRYAMVFTGPWNVQNFTNSGVDFDVSLIPQPTKAEIEQLKLTPIHPDAPEVLGAQAWSSSNVGGQTGVIFKASPQPELAFELIDYFISEPVQRRWASELGQIPVRRAAWENLDTTKFPFMPKFMKQLLVSKRIPPIPLYGTLESNVYNPQIDLFLNQSDFTSDQMIKAMDKAMEDQIVARINEPLG